MRLSFVVQETLSLPFDNYSFVCCLLNHMIQVLLADKMLSQVDLHLNSANADKMSGLVTTLYSKLLHKNKRGDSKRFLNLEGVINTPITSCFLMSSAKFTAAQQPDLLFLLSIRKNGESVPPLGRQIKTLGNCMGSAVCISLCFVHLEYTLSK